jgi:hypothetical protein
MLEMLNATTQLMVGPLLMQLMVGPLLMRSVFFFSRGVRVDVLRGFFSAENLLRQQGEAETKER